MNNQPSLDLEQQEVALIAEKQSNWSKLALQVHNTEKELQLRSSKAINSLKIPLTIEDVKECEQILIDYRKEISSIVDKRKTITSKFDALSQRLMESEKLMPEKSKEVENAIINLKKIEEKKQFEIDEKNKELKNLVNQISQLRINLEASFKTRIADQINKAYNWALENDVTSESKDEYLKKVESKYKVKDFVPEIDKIKIPLNRVSIEEFNKIVNENMVIDSQSYIDNYIYDLRFKFSDFDVALMNKKQALVNSNNALNKENEKIKNETENKQVASKLELMSQPLDVNITIPLKALKKVYKIDMVDSFENMTFIMKSYFANLQLTKPKTRLSINFNFSVKNAMVALEAVKKEDNLFAPANINFIEVDKL